MANHAHHVRIPAPGALLDAELALPPQALGVVAFAHGSGSGRFSPRNQFVAEVLRRDAHCATLLVDLLTQAEQDIDEHTAVLRFDVDLLGTRLAHVCDWLQSDGRTAGLPIGLYGASTGASAALMAAARPYNNVRAIVSRGGRPDLVGPAVLGEIRAPTLLIVGERDEIVIDLNIQAMRAMHAECKLVVIPEATHLFEEPGALEQVAAHAVRWLDTHLTHHALRATPG
jgi:dienelactone hydrolase